ncbi:MAG: hypothetical protein COT17_00930 [Elusimicrobia bacterium CG08_land_8_20_14_0_20_51_18]|nr:MAG: hypothetical protein COT17_00930 [Elusimicrobia bacterium CG08_land_8_20_14_0_20_51_18]
MPDFEFKTELHLVKLLGVKARNIQELLDNLQNVPLSSVYYHTHRFLKQHHFLSPEPPNDFAYWIKNTLNLKTLSEEIASIDTVKYESLKELRSEISGIISSCLEREKEFHNCQKGDEFHFMSCQTFVMPAGKKASDLKEFYEAMKTVDISSIYFHIFEAKLRLKRNENDFQAWLGEIGEKELARKLSNLDPYNMTLENLRKQILKILAVKI